MLKAEPGTARGRRGCHSSEVQTLSIDSSFPAVDPTLQNPCITTALDNSKKRKGRTKALHIFYTFSVIFGAEILPSPLPLACQLSCATIKDQSYEVLRLLNVFRLGSLGVH